MSAKKARRSLAKLTDGPTRPLGAAEGFLIGSLAREATRGPGRPPLDPTGGETYPLTVRLIESDLEKLHLLMSAHKLGSLADAARWCIRAAKVPKKRGKAYDGPHAARQGTSGRPAHITS